MTLIITRHYVLLQKFLLCRTPGGSMANWEHEEGVSQRLAELITSDKVSRQLQRKSTKAITQGMSDNYRILFLNQPLHTIKYTYVE